MSVKNATGSANTFEVQISPNHRRTDEPLIIHEIQHGSPTETSVRRVNPPVGAFAIVREDDPQRLVDPQQVSDPLDEITVVGQRFTNAPGSIDSRG